MIMRSTLVKPIASSAVLGLVLAALLWFFGPSYGQKQVQMTHVGGQANQCNCTERIEK